LIEQDLQTSGIQIVEKMAKATPADYAQLAKHVFTAAQHQDAVAMGIVRQAADYVAALAEGLWRLNPGRLAWLGGLSAELKPWLPPDINARFSEPLDSAEWGAVMFAQQQLAPAIR
jgi:glucosamine kinase